MHPESFLKAEGWADAAREPLCSDMSPRVYTRLRKEGRDHTAILVRMPRDDSPDALIGHLYGDMLYLNAHFRAHGIRVPEIYAADPENALALIEDFGDLTLDKALAAGAIGKAEAYTRAAQALRAFHDVPFPEEKTAAFRLRVYERSHIRKALAYFPQWVLPEIIRGQSITGTSAKTPLIQNSSSPRRREPFQNNLPKDPRLRGDDDSFIKDYTAEWADAWEEVFRARESGACRALLHVDFFPGNLALLPDGEIGILDYQGALEGPTAYDLVNLAADARRMPDPGVESVVRGAYAPHPDVLEDWAPLAAEFHARVAGQCLKIAAETGQTRYLAFVPCALAHLRRDLESDPRLAPVMRFLQRNAFSL